MQALNFSEGTDKRAATRTTGSRRQRAKIVKWYRENMLGCNRCMSGRRRYTTPEGGRKPVPPPMTFVGKHYGDRSDFFPILFVGGNPWVKDSWVDEMSVADLARWWEQKIYEWIDYRLGPVLEAVAPLARAIWQIHGIKDDSSNALLDYVAFTNMYKCPLKNSGSKPCAEDANKCVGHLTKELQILSPKMVVLFGLPAWKTLTRQSSIDNKVSFNIIGKDDYCAQLTVEKTVWPVLTLHHPSLPRYQPNKYLENALFKKAVRWCLRQINATDAETPS